MVDRHQRIAASGDEQRRLAAQVAVEQQVVAKRTAEEQATLLAQLKSIDLKLLRGRTNLAFGLTPKDSKFDVGVTYRTTLEDLGLPDWASLSFRSLYTNTWERTTTPDEISAPIKCADKFGTRCGNPTPRHKLRTAVNWKMNQFGLNVVWNHLDDVNDDAPATKYTVERIGAKNYWDLSGDWEVNDNVAFTAGVKNLTQESYPILGGNASPSKYAPLPRHHCCVSKRNNSSELSHFSTPSVSSRTRAGFCAPRSPDRKSVV